MAMSWICPFCNQPTTITDSDISSGSTSLLIDNKDGEKILNTLFVVCPNPKCKKFTLIATLYDAEFNRVQGEWVAGKFIKKWSLIPSSKAKPFPSYIPKPIIQDYEEACQIAVSSPNAAATLARRCLQGMIRDFWKISGKKNLKDEIDAIAPQVDPLTWRAIDAIRKIGKIGAHMEQDINLIIDVEPEEADQLIGLIEMLIKDWYINKHERIAQLERITKQAEEKEQLMKHPTK